MRRAIFRGLAVVALAGPIGCSGSGGGGADAQDASEASSMHVSPTPDAGDAESLDATLDAPYASLDAAFEVGDGGAGDAACATGSVTFTVQNAPGSATGYCVDHSFPVFSPAWLGIRPAGDAGPLLFGDQCPGVSACGECTCNGGGGRALLADGGEQITWDGTYSVYGAGSCGRCAPCGQCFVEGCAPPGDYVATFCGYEKASDAADCTTQKCVDTAFVWPPRSGSGTVLGLLGP